MNILITGNNGYIASELKRCFPTARLVSVREISDFSFLNNMDVLIHTAAIVHKKELPEMEQQYTKINTELTIELAQQAKNAGVQHFVFLSTMAVYGKKSGVINEQTELLPNTFYGKSKLEAELKLLAMQDHHFHVAVVRPPMVYGRDCPGNYALLSKLSRKTPIFPDVQNLRSMIFIGNLVSFIQEIVANQDSGVYHPQDPQLVNTTKMVGTIAKMQSKKMYTTKLGAGLLKLLIGRTSIYNKVFGDLYYSESLSKYRNNVYQQYTVNEAIRLTEKGMRLNETTL